MKLAGLLLALTVQAVIYKLNLLLIFEASSQWVHQKSLNMISSFSTSYDWFYKAILFGHDSGLHQKLEIKSFIAIGLYHLIVVSGSHLIILEKLITKLFHSLPFRIKKFFTFLTLFLFTAANLFQPACLRSLIQWCLSSFLKKHFCNGFDLIIFASACCLLINPQLIYSLSFHLSAAATLALQISQEFSLKALGKTFLCVLFTAPFLMCVQPCLSIMVFIASIIAMPLLELTLLPFGLLMFFVPFLRKYTEFLLDYIFNFSKWLAQFDVPQFCFEQQRSSLWGFILLVLLFFVSRLILVVAKRNQLQKILTSSYSGM